MKRILLALTWGTILALPYPFHLFSVARAEGPPRGALQTVSLRDQLEKGLKARRPEDFEFVDRVVAAVDADKLPLVEVQKVFLWARKQKPYPFPYFERRMRTVAEDFGVAL